jgi:type I restriction-modification system DNA methylase subunit
MLLSRTATLPTTLHKRCEIDTTTLGDWPWEAACTIRGPLDAPKFKDCILPLVFLKRLSEVFDDEEALLAHPGFADWRES